MVQINIQDKRNVWLIKYFPKMCNSSLVYNFRSNNFLELLWFLKLNYQVKWWTGNPNKTRHCKHLYDISYTLSGGVFLSTVIKFLIIRSCWSTHPLTWQLMYSMTTVPKVSGLYSMAASILASMFFWRISSAIILCASVSNGSEFIILK